MFYRPHHTKRLLQFPPRLPAAPGRRPCGGAPWLKGARGDSHPGFLEKAAWWGPGALRRFSAARGRWRASGEEAHFLLKGALSAPIISHCPVALRGSTFFYSIASFRPSPISQEEPCRCTRVLKNTRGTWQLAHSSHSRTNALIKCVY